MNHLRPCPFCGGQNIDPQFALDGDGNAMPGCCDCSGSADTPRDWNKRATDDLLREALSAMLNLAPRYRDERGGCFGSGHDVPCPCTACKIKRELNL